MSENFESLGGLIKDVYVDVNEYAECIVKE